MSLWLCLKTVYRSPKVVDEKESSNRKTCWQHLGLCVYSLKFVSIVTVKVCVCQMSHIISFLHDTVYTEEYKHVYVCLHSSYIYIYCQELVSCQNIFINPQELILRPIAASKKSKVVAGNRTPGLLIRSQA